VGDYTFHLADALIRSGAKVQVLRPLNSALFAAVEAATKSGVDLIHIQYPTVGFGWTLAAQKLALMKACLVTFHEASHSHILRKLSLLPFCIRAKHLIFTSDYEREFLTKWAPWTRKTSSTIPIASNIAECDEVKQRVTDEILYFGRIMPHKGIENVIRLAELIQQSGLALRVRILGSCLPVHGSYLGHLKTEADGLPIMWEHDLNEKEIAERLAGASIAYLPYRDGVSERRATVKAMLSNGVAVLTTRGTHTPSAFNDLVCFCATPEEALAAALSLLSNHERTTSMVRSGKVYSEQFTWEHIAKKHMALYEKLVSPDPQRQESLHIELDRNSTR
jgi:glycosyltransferase involved in cell wall biosynthesis